MSRRQRLITETFSLVVMILIFTTKKKEFKRTTPIYNIGKLCIIRIQQRLKK
jgi:hypothetical protein